MTRRRPNSATLGRILCGLAVALMPLLLTACDRGTGNDDAGPATRPSDAAGAAPTHFEQTPGNGTAAVNRVLLKPAVPPAPKPTGPLPKDASCVTAECHATLASANYVHGPVSTNSCNSCHEDDTGNHTYPLKRKGNDGCTFCHSVVGGASHRHAVLSQQDGCQSCHDPHASQAKFLIKADTVEHLCARCHQVPLNRFAHEPFAKGQCTACHNPHEGNGKALLRTAEGAEHCLSCHGEMKEKIASVARVTTGIVHEPVKQCQLCHSPHSTEFAHQLKQPVDQTCMTGSCHASVAAEIKQAAVPHDAVTMGQGCGNCHDAHASLSPALQKARMDETCLACHDKAMPTRDGRTIAAMGPVLRESKFLHGAIKFGECSACHKPHGAQEHSLLTRAFPALTYTPFEEGKYALCLEGCHRPELVTTQATASLTNFRDGERNLHFVHVNRDDKGRSCKTCHAIHGSNLPNHMASEVAFEGSSWAMPIGFEKAADGGSCSPGCHEPKTYRRAGGTLAVATTQPTTMPANRAAAAAATTQMTTTKTDRGVP